MSQDTKPWSWSEDAKKMLDFILISAMQTDSYAKQHLRSLAVNLLHAKAKSAKKKLCLQSMGADLGKIARAKIESHLAKPRIEKGVVAPKAFTKPKIETGVVAPKELIKQEIRTSHIQVAPIDELHYNIHIIDRKAEEIKDSIPKMETSELHKIIKDLMNDKPVVEIARSLNQNSR